jgi:hypothetical protein
MPLKPNGGLDLARRCPSRTTASVRLVYMPWDCESWLRGLLNACLGANFDGQPGPREPECLATANKLGGEKDRAAGACCGAK